MGFDMSEKSLAKLQGIHPDLVRVVRDCAANGVMPFMFSVIQGLRSEAEEAAYVKEGRSHTMNSRHLDGHAVDLMVVKENGEATWDWPWYEQLNVQMQAAATRCNVPVVWGGSWLSLKDGDHWELPRGLYPSYPKPDAPIAA